MQTDHKWLISALRKGHISLEGQFVYGSNYTFMVTCEHEEQSFKAVYKPIRGERPLWDFPGQTLARREVAAYLVSQALGWNFVPPTVFRLKDAPMGSGSAQVFIEHDPNHHYFNFNEAEKSYLPRVMLFDILINNADRKGGHLIIDAEGKLWLIDHGLSFHVKDKLRSVVWDYAGQTISPDLISDVKVLIAALSPGEPLYQSLQPHLLPIEIDALKNRAEMMVDEGHFPLPPEDQRAYPWPLV